MADSTVVYYDDGDGPNSGYALAPEGAGTKAPILIVFPDNGGPHALRFDVPRRAEGGGVTFRPEK